MELWFIFSLVSMVALGMYSFTPKVAAMNNYDGTLFTCYANLTAFFVSLVALAVFSDFSGWGYLLMLFALGNGLLHTMGKIFRVDSLRYIDATIFFPLYKVTGPLIVIAFALVAFGERFNWLEWLGVVASLVVPLLLISKVESTRQSNLIKGLQLMVLTALFTSLASVVNKLVADGDFNSYLFVTLALGIGTIFSFGKYIYAHRATVLATTLKTHSPSKLIWLSALSGLLQFIGFLTYILALEFGASLAIAFTINSLYIIFPIILAIIFYHEHWNARKAIAILLSIVALGLLH